MLEFIDTGGTYDYLMIRPDSDASTDDFTTASQTITSARGAYTATQWATASSTTGEQIWANVYSIGTIADDTHIYVYQGPVDTDGDRKRVYSWNDSTQDWWTDGHIDICVALKDIEETTWAIIDGGYLSVFARKYGHLYDNFEVSNSTTSGGRNPIPLSTASDLNNTTGYKQFTLSGGSGNWNVGDEISGDTSGARAIITDVSGSNPTPTLTYYLIDDPLTDFNGSEAITNEDDTGAATGSGSTSATGPADSDWFTSDTTPTVSFGNTTFDVDDDGTSEYYGITINCQNNPLSEVYEWLKYATRRGETTNDLDGINGESYIGGEVYLAYSTLTNSIAEGESLAQATSGATGVVISHDTSNKVMLLRDVRGSFNTTNQVDSDDSSGYFTPTAAVTFSPSKQSPLGTFAGGTFFGARGVLISNWISADENSFILTPIDGGTKSRPQAISIEVTNLVGGAQTLNTSDLVGVFRLTESGGVVDKTEYDCAGGESAGDPSITVSGSIAQDVPGKTTGGSLVIVDDPAGAGTEYKLRYASWTGSVFTLANTASSATAGTDEDTLVDSGASFTTTARRGDLLYTAKGVSYVKTVDDDYTLQLTTAITGLTTSDAYELNAVPVALTSSDDVYVPLIDRMATSTAESVSIIYVSPIYFRVKVRNTRNSTKIKPYSSDGSTSGTDQSIPVVRTEDTIIT